jgi:hypothetical protein
MSCEHLICARCAGLVVEERCEACRAAKAHVHHSQPNLGLPLALIALVAALLLVLAFHLH